MKNFKEMKNLHLILLTLLFIIIISIFYTLGYNDAGRGHIALIEALKRSITEGFGFGYSFGNLGGQNIPETIAIPFLMKGLIHLGLPSVGIYNLLVILFFFNVALFSFLTGEEKKSFLIFLINAFSAIIIWRISYGHLNFVLWISGIYAFFNLFLLDKKFKGPVLYGLYIISVLSLEAGVSYGSYQLTLYAILFLPFIILLNRSLLCKKKPLILVALTALGSLYSLLPTLILQIKEGANRGLDTSVLYSYAPYKMKNFFLSLTSFSLNDLHALDPYLVHELHMPIDLLLIIPFIYILLKQERKKILILSGLYLVLSLSFVIQSPLSALFESLPIINSFRVPQRIFIVLGLTILIYVSLNIKEIWNNKNIKLLLFILAGYQVLCLGQNVFKFQKNGNIITATPDLFERSWINIKHSKYQLNIGIMSQINAVDGYGYPTKKFRELLEFISDTEISPQYSHWGFNKRNRRLNEPLTFLYNIKSEYSIDKGTLLKTKIPTKLTNNLFINSNEFSEFLKTKHKFAKTISLPKDTAELQKIVNLCEVDKISIDSNRLCFTTITKNKLCNVILRTNYAPNLFLENIQTFEKIKPETSLRAILKYMNLENDKRYCIYNCITSLL